MTIHISKGNSKVGKIPNISLVPIKDCGNCEYCKEKCYALKAWKQYPGVRKAWEDNSKEFRENPEKACSQIAKYLFNRDISFFRIHVAGDFLNQNHINAWINLCKCFPGIDFMVNTKMFNLDYSEAPVNMHIRFSMWPGQDIPEGRIPLSQEVTEDFSVTPMPKAWLDDGTEIRIPSDAFICTGNCDDCLNCYLTDSDVVFKLH